ncbi:MAG: hypothetical protein N2747_08835 [Chitinophagaceae bacterium]|nr:hypothetical protein [Chitinophagaceae bacterium]
MAVLFYKAAKESEYENTLKQMLEYRRKKGLEDWLYYQLIRRVSHALSPKQENYFRYTLYKWFFLNESGYDATLKVSDEKMLFYVHTDENIYNIPCYVKNGKQYVCLNYHDYGNEIDFGKEKFTEISLQDGASGVSFSYRITALPEMSENVATDKWIQFDYGGKEFSIPVKFNPEIRALFQNYPVVDYESCFNIPLSNVVKSTLIPELKKYVKGLPVKKGVEYLMYFTRYAFHFKKDDDMYGSEKRFSPELTLISEASDCEDRAALFFALVKEIYNLPMLVITFPDHVTVAVRLNKPRGKTITYKGEKYTLCEPTPQRIDLSVGQWAPTLRKKDFEIAFSYQPSPER